MRFSRSSTIQSNLDPPTQIDVQAQVHILIETAMEQTQLASTDTALIVRQLAAELNNMEATLSDVRVAVQDLYQGDRPSAQAYLDYLAENGFPPAAPEVSQAPETCQQTISAGQMAAQNQAIASYQPNAYGQLDRPPNATANGIAFYSGNLIAELVANSAYSALVFGERRSGTSAILRAIAYDQIAKQGDTLLDILDLHNGEWGGMEDIQLPDGSRIVNYLVLSVQGDLAAFASKLLAVAAEVRRRQRSQRGQGLALSENQSPSPYLFLIDGLSEVHGALPGWTADRRSKDTDFSSAASSLRFVLCHGPRVGVICVATARDHSTCLCDATALGETKLLFLGRVSTGRNGGYRAIAKAIEDKEVLPSPQDRSRYRQALALVKQNVQPVVFTPNGIPRMGRLGDFSGYLSVDLLAHYQQALEVQA